MPSDDPQLLLDLQCAGNNKLKTKFERFYEEVEKYFEAQLMPVHARRHGEQLYMPMTISVRERPVPCAETLALQFHPINQHVSTAAWYTGRFRVKFRVQTRIARLAHPHQHYVAAQFKYLKDFAVANRKQLTFVCDIV